MILTVCSTFLVFRTRKRTLKPLSQELMTVQIKKWPSANRILLILIVLAGIWLGTGALSIYRTNDGSNDFDTFYAAGKAVLKAEGIYYVGDYYKTREESGLFLYPPIAACIFAPFALLPISAAAFLWNTLLLILFGGTLILILKYLGVSSGALPSFWTSIPKRDRWLFAFVSAVMLIDNLGMAQINILVFFLCAWALVLRQSGKSFVSGLVLSFAIFLKLTPVIFCFYFVLKRSWKLVGGVIVGILLLSLIFPVLIFGWETNRIYHRQWLGRMVKPMVADVMDKIKKEKKHPFKKSLGEIQGDRTDWMFADSNQSLEAALARLFLKDRSKYFYSGPELNHVTKPYEKLPALGGGVSNDVLIVWVRAIRLVAFVLLAYLWFKRTGEKESIRGPLEISLVFLSTTLLSPIARSHYFIVWVFAYMTLFFIRSQDIKLPHGRFLLWSAKVSCFLYLFQALPYGEGIGMGTWANLAFWVGCASNLGRKQFPRAERFIDK